MNTNRIRLNAVAASLALMALAAAGGENRSLPLSDIGQRATADYHGDALAVTATSDGALLRCGFQRLSRWGQRFSVSGDEGLAQTGSVSAAGQLVRFIRPGVTDTP